MSTDTDRAEKLKQKLVAAPQTPGVYYMLDAAETVLYIGKARRLRSRLRSYFRRDTDEKTARLVQSVADIKWQETGNEVDALLLESELIKEVRPRFNIRLKDDKSFPYITLTRSEPFPRLYLTRRIKENQDRYYGPFTDSRAARKLVALLQKSFCLRKCRTMRSRKAGCLNAQIKLCCAPCAGGRDAADYRRAVEQCERILQGKGRALLRELESKMASAAAALDYEAAAVWRDAVRSVTRVLGKRGLFQEQKQGRNLGTVLRPALLELQRLLGLPGFPVRIEGYDIAQGQQGRHAVGAKVSMVWGQPERSAYRLYAIRTAPANDDCAMLMETLTRRLTHAEDEFPDLILVDGGKGQLSAARSALRTCGAGIPVLAVAKKKEIFYSGRGTELPAVSPAARNLLLRLRDETHRFVNAAFRRRRRKSAATSVLEQVPGIGPARAEQLLRHCSLAEILAAPIGDIAQRTRVPEKLVRRVQEILGR